MKPLSTSSGGADTLRQPTHDEISQRARLLWEREGQPTDRDEQIWLEAERQLFDEANASAPKDVEAEVPSMTTGSLPSPAKEEATKARGRARVPRGRAAAS